MVRFWSGLSAAFHGPVLAYICPSPPTWVAEIKAADHVTPGSAGGLFAPFDGLFSHCKAHSWLLILLTDEKRLRPPLPFICLVSVFTPPEGGSGRSLGLG